MTKALHIGVSTLLLAVCATLAGCNLQQAAQAAAAPAQPTIDQTNLCEVKAWQHDVVAQACKPGEKVVFLPDSWGNEQLPVIFAAVNCDMRFAVTITKGAVTCIYTPITPKKAP
ncbi:hypothetical protein [Hydrogenophaga defluvii]|uniref:Lipoprotein n=1 Tax=Hydrogenophaga defluvii TaxID=249410 RepID=A0ABW2SG69_9BURK